LLRSEQLWEDDVQSDYDNDDDGQEELTNSALGNTNGDGADKDMDDDDDEDDNDESALIPDDDISDTESDSSNLDHEARINVLKIGDLLNKCRTIITTIRKSTILHDAVRTIALGYSINVDLILDMRIRWNSSYKMLNRLFIFQGVLEEFYTQLDSLNSITKRQQEKLMGAILSNSDRGLLQSLRFVLERFSDATELISGKSYPTLSIAYAVKLSLDHFLNDLTGDTNVRIIKQMLQAQFDHYTTLLTDSKEANIINAAALLDPSTHETLKPEDSKAAEKFLILEVRRITK
jgi:hypothetical protein